VLRLVNRGIDYGVIKRTWNLPMVLKANRAIDIQEKADRLAAKKARDRAKQKKEG
jgi:hypothetical protein